ncbi:MAG: 16S rRNA (guanine(527)-N(7))-methyltransferase RsmG [Deltaproteobacteria bacterium]|nr:MAG: 16S rRNA (guanine(527)-N(7))-methyltransferase RsmG [Deltaproteobacteria bacterium]
MKFDEEFKTFLKNCINPLGIFLSDNELEKFRIYAKELVDWNKKKNLTAITDPESIAVLHFADSLYLSSLIDNKKGTRLIDAGSGGGFPGIPLKIARPEIEITMIDSSGKKVSFLKYIIRLLGLEKISAINKRVEDFANENKDSFDYAVSRAFTSIDSFFEKTAPCIKPGGRIIAMKGPDCDNEIASMKKKTYFFEGKTINGKNIRAEISNYMLPVINHKRKIISLTH